MPDRLRRGPCDPPHRGRAPEREVSPKATIDPFPYCWGAGAGGGPSPTAAYSAPPTVLIPPNVAPPSDNRVRTVPVFASRTASCPAELAVYSTPFAIASGLKSSDPPSAELQSSEPSRASAATWLVRALEP